MDNLYRHKSLWDHKPVLRAIYLRYYRLIAKFTKGGRSLEIGGGSGNFKEFYPDVITTDIVFTPWADVVADAHRLPFRPFSFENLILVDVLHHLENPCTFIDEAKRLLRPNGRIILIEPCISLYSAPFYHWFHPEPVDMDADPFVVVQPDKHRRPFDANQAIPTLMFLKGRQKFEMKYKDLSIVHIDRFDFLAYPLSGGFRPWSLIPSAWVAPISAIETFLPSLLRDFLSFRLIVVLAKH